MIGTKPIVVNGHDYSYDYDRTTRIIEVFDTEKLIAVGEYNSDNEAFIVNYIMEDGTIEDGGALSIVYYDHPLEETARWLAITHPEYSWGI